MRVSAVARRVTHHLVAAALAVSVFGAATTIANADDVTFIIKNSHTYAVEVELYSQDRNHVWPGGNQVYYLDDGDSKQVPLSCNSGETICYGAWIANDKGTYWGTGPDNKERCEDCCYTCEGGETEEIELVE